MHFFLQNLLPFFLLWSMIGADGFFGLLAVTEVLSP